MQLIWPDDLDDVEDQAFLSSLIESQPDPSEVALVGGAVAVVWWTTETGDRRWTVYRPTGQPALSEILGHMSMAQHHLIEAFGMYRPVEDDD